MLNGLVVNMHMCMCNLVPRHSPFNKKGKIVKSMHVCMCEQYVSPTQRKALKLTWYDVVCKYPRSKEIHLHDVSHHFLLRWDKLLSCGYT